MTFDPFGPPPDEHRPPEPPAAPAEPPPPPIERGSLLGTVLAWTIIVLSIVALLTARQLRAPAAVADDAPVPAKPAAEVAAELTLRLVSRHAVGLRAWTAGAGDMQGQWEAMAHRIERTPESPEQRLRAAAVLAELRGADAAVQSLEALDDLPEPLQADARALRVIYTSGRDTLDSDARQHLRERHGWYGELALGWGQPPEDPDRRRAISAARRTAAVLTLATLGGFAVGMAALVLFVIAIVLLAQGSIQRAYRPPMASGGVYVEAFALYIGWFVAMGLIARPAGGLGDVRWFWGLIATLAPLACLWPLLRGVSFGELRHALGWHSGRGWWREIFSGFVGYLAGLPIIAGGVLITFVLARYMRVQPTHPIVEEITGPMVGVILVLILAAIYAPLAEETMFRGALHHGVRRWAPFILAAIVVSFIFAIIHPQGLAAVPALMSIAIVLAALREWRGSLIAPVIAHAIHNGTLLVLLLLAVR